MKIWDAIKRPFAKTSVAAMEQKDPLSSSYGGGNGGLLTRIMSTGNAPRRGTKEILVAYKELPWLRAVVDRIAWSTSSVHWSLGVEGDSVKRTSNGIRTKAQQLEEIYVPSFSLLMDRPNPVMTGRTMRQTAQIHLELTGESFIIIERNNQGMPVELWPIPPTWVQNTPSDGESSTGIP